MAQGIKEAAVGGKKDPVKGAKREARSLPLARGGVKTGREFAGLMSSLMSDLIDGRIAPNVANAVCNASGKLLKVVEMEHKYGRKSNEQNDRVLTLAP